MVVVLCKHVPDIAGALRAVQAILPKLEVKMIEFLAEWMVILLMPARHVIEVRAPHLSFMMLKEYWFPSNASEAFARSLHKLLLAGN